MGAIPMQTSLLLTPARSAREPAARPARSVRSSLAGVLAGAGVLLLPVAMFLPWYRDNVGGETLSAWGGYWFVIAEMLLLFLAGAWLALSLLAGRPLRGRALNGTIGLAFAVTITVVISLFAARPGGNTATAAAFGGYVGLAAINTIKGGAILATINAHRRVTRGPAPRMNPTASRLGQTRRNPAGFQNSATGLDLGSMRLARIR